MAKTKRRAVKNPITGKVEFYQGSKTMGIRDPISGEIIKRVKKEKSWF
jgi:hypothetical protein